MNSSGKNKNSPANRSESKVKRVCIHPAEPPPASCLSIARSALSSVSANADGFPRRFESSLLEGTAAQFAITTKVPIQESLRSKGPRIISPGPQAVACMFDDPNGSDEPFTVNIEKQTTGTTSE